MCKSNESYQEPGSISDEICGTVRPAFLLRGRSLRKALTACHGTSEALSLGQKDVTYNAVVLFSCFARLNI